MDCLICCEEKDCLIFSCKHSVCRLCYIKTGKTTCPFCRKEVIDELDNETRDLTKYVIDLNKNNTEMEEDRDIALNEADEADEEAERIAERYLNLRNKYIKLKVKIRLNRSKNKNN